MLSSISYGSQTGDSLPLDFEIATRQIQNVLFCHLSTRWYVGELFCHASWIDCFRQAGIPASVCTKQSYLELFEADPAIVSLYSDTEFSEELASKFDLVVFAGTHEPDSFFARIPRSIYSWNKGLAYVERSILKSRVEKNSLNHFRNSMHRYGQTALPDADLFQITLRAEEHKTANSLLDSLGVTGTAIVLNPTASNPYTRESTRPKAVENQLALEDYIHLLHSLRECLPGHYIVLGAALKSGDLANYTHIEEIVREFAEDDRVINLLSQTLPEEGFSFRQFAAVLSDPRIQGMLGNSTGSNAPLAASVNLPAMSIERSADDAMRANWLAPQRGQMGSLRWRNPHPLSANFNLAWSDRTTESFARIAQAFKIHLATMNGQSISEDPLHVSARPAAKRIWPKVVTEAPSQESLAHLLKELMILRSYLIPEAASFYFDFQDEADYLRTVGYNTEADLVLSFGVKGLGNLVSNPESVNLGLISSVFQESNLYKLIRRLAEQ
jgi:hypothetical protein